MGKFVGDQKQWGEWQKTVTDDKTVSSYFGRCQDFVKEHQGKAYWYQSWIVLMLMLQVLFIKFITDPEANVQAVFWLRIVDTVLRLTVMPQIDKVHIKLAVSRLWLEMSFRPHSADMAENSGGLLRGCLGSNVKPCSDWLHLAVHPR